MIGFCTGAFVLATWLALWRTCAAGGAMDDILNSVPPEQCKTVLAMARKSAKISMLSIPVRVVVVVIVSFGLATHVPHVPWEAFAAVCIAAGSFFLFVIPASAVSRIICVTAFNKEADHAILELRGLIGQEWSDGVNQHATDQVLTMVQALQRLSAAWGNEFFMTSCAVAKPMMFITAVLI